MWVRRDGRCFHLTHFILIPRPRALSLGDFGSKNVEVSESSVAMVTPPQRTHSHTYTHAQQTNTYTHSLITNKLINTHTHTHTSFRDDYFWRQKLTLDSKLLYVTKLRAAGQEEVDVYVESHCGFLAAAASSFLFSVWV